MSAELREQLFRAMAELSAATGFRANEVWIPDAYLREHHRAFAEALGLTLPDEPPPAWALFEGR